MANDNKGRRKFLANFSTLVASGAVFPLAGNSTVSVQKKQTPIGLLTAPYLQNLKHDEVTIIFITSADSFSWIEYGEGNFEKEAVTIEDGFLSANTRLYAITLRNLKPDSEYKYRITSKPIIQFEPYALKYGESFTSEGFHFTTYKKDSNSVTCLILNDIHDRPYSFKDLFAHVRNFDFDFVALNGDMFDYQTDEQQIIDHLLIPCTDLFASEKPFLMIRGNHETRGKYARQFKDYFSYDKDQYYFSFKQGPVHFIVLDTGEDKPDNHPVYGGIVAFDQQREKQVAWMERELKDEKFRKCKFKVVLMHIPTFYSGDAHGTLHCRALFNAVFEKHNIDMVISGHTHEYGIHPPTAEHKYPILIGGGPLTGKRTIMKLSANERSLSVEMIRDDGLPIGTYKCDSKP